MKNIVIKVFTRAEIEDIVKECKAYIDQNGGQHVNFIIKNL